MKILKSIITLIFKKQTTMNKYFIYGSILVNVITKIINDSGTKASAILAEAKKYLQIVAAELANASGQELPIASTGHPVLDFILNAFPGLLSLAQNDIPALKSVIGEVLGVLNILVPAIADPNTAPAPAAKAPVAAPVKTDAPAQPASKPVADAKEEDKVQVTMTKADAVRIRQLLS